MKYLIAILLLLTGCATAPVAMTPLTEAQADQDAANVVRLKAQLATNAAAMMPPLPTANSLTYPQGIGLPPTAPAPVTNVIECTIWPANGHQVFLMVSPDLLHWQTVSSVEYPVEGAVLDFTNAPTNSPTVYRVGVN